MRQEIERGEEEVRNVNKLVSSTVEDLFRNVINRFPWCSKNMFVSSLLNYIEQKRQHEPYIRISEMMREIAM